MADEYLSVREACKLIAEAFREDKRKLSFPKISKQPIKLTDPDK